MVDTFYIAWKYIRYNRVKSAILVSCITIIAVLPLTLEVLLNESERQLTLRAESSPLLIGAKGSALDLVMNSLYFTDEIPEPITMAAAGEVMDSGLAGAIPLYIRFSARTFPIVGTTLDYFEYRNLAPNSGELFTTLGQCVIGAEVAKTLKLASGDYIVSSPETLFDLAGVYPLKMKISGVLTPSRSADDRAVFVDIHTAWVIDGLGHGHTDVTTTTDNSVILKKEAQNVTANAKLMHYSEITEDNIDSFHLHGDPEGFPLTAVLAVPHDDKSGTILRGRYLEADTLYQAVRPAEVIDGLMATIFRIRTVLDAVIGVVGGSTLLALVLVFSLSLRLREQEIDIVYKLGCSRATISRLLGAEIVLILLAGAIGAGAFLLVVSHYDQQLVRTLLL
jgi:putative ABC transport system permease protein